MTTPEPSTPAPSIDELVQEAEDAYDRVVAMYYDAKMRTVQLPGTGWLYVPAPPGSGRSPRATIGFLEPLIRARNPEWVYDSKAIPAHLRNARRKRSGRPDLFTVEPDRAGTAYRLRSAAAARRIARALRRDGVDATISRNDEAGLRMVANLLTKDAVDSAREAEAQLPPEQGGAVWPTSPEAGPRRAAEREEAQQEPAAPASHGAMDRSPQQQPGAEEGPPRSRRPGLEGLW